MSLRTLRLPEGLAPALAGGHPWVYRNHLPRSEVGTGEWVRLEAGGEQAFGIYDADGAIGVRIFSWRGLPDRAWFEERIDEALALRTGLEAGGTDAYRLLNGEGDGLPGIVADRYERHLVVRAYSKGVAAALPEVVRALARRLRPRGVALRERESLEPLFGELPPPEVTVTEHGLHLLANLYEGQKTGLFLDQRENRATVRRLAAGRDVLNLFAYNGGFTVAALAGGARHVVSVDIAAPALHDAERNVLANGFDASRHEGVAADVFEALRAFAAEGRRFDLVVCDPPSLARGKRSRDAALHAYRRLNALALRCVAPGGLLATASCTAQVSPAEFGRAVAQAAAERGVTAQVIHEAGHARDHPVPTAFPEGRYLKFLVLRVLARS